MPLLDSYGQNIPFPLQTDKPNARTFGESLVEAVAPKTVMRFPSRSVRNATITNPQAGMVAWVSDIGMMELYDGSAWVAMATGTNAWTPISRSSGYVLENNNDQGVPAYRVVNLFGERALMLRGGVGVVYQSGGSAPNNGELTNPRLPQSIWPSNRRTVPLAASVVGGADPAVKLDINTDGSLVFVGINSNNQPPWISLNGVICSL